MTISQLTLPVSAVILAAGEGSRMRSDRPKPLHRLCGRPMLTYVLDSLVDVGLERAVVVVGHKADRVTKKMREQSHAVALEFVEQRVQRGTGDATLVGLVGIPDSEDESDVIVMPGDAPLMRAETIVELVQHHRDSGAAATLLTAKFDDPTGYGRVVHGPSGRIERIVEHRDATPEELAINEVNTSIYCFRRSLLAPALRRIEPDNSQGEYYLTDVIGVLVDAGHPVESLVAKDANETQGVNDRVQLAAAEAELRRRTNLSLQHNGVTLVDPQAVYVDTTVQVDRDVTLFPGVILSGDTTIGEGSEIGPGTRLIDCVVGPNSVLNHVVGKSAKIGSECHVGPYAVLDQDSVVPDGVRTGPFFSAPEGTGNYQEKLFGEEHGGTGH